MKTVFSNSMLCHTWANQLQNYGKGSSMYFEGNTIYSYGRHYEIAQIVKAPTYPKVFFINSNGYSNTTAKHTNHVWRSIPDIVPNFRVPFINNKFNIDDLPKIIDKMLIQVKKHFTDQINARSYFGHFAAGSMIFDDIAYICEIFNLPVPVRPSNYLDAQIKADQLRETQAQRQEQKEAKELQKSLELLAKWLNYEYNGTLYNIPVHLRVSKDGKLIETTKGAKVDYLAALRLLSKLRNNENVHGEKIDGFTVIENNSQKIKIGCHEIDWAIINNLNIG
jgi:hypothetical protein